MIDLGLNQYKVKEIKYELNERKSVIFKLCNCQLEDVEIVETIKEPIGKMSAEELAEAVERCKCKKCNCDKQYEIDKTIVDEHVAVEEKKVNDNFNKLSKVNAARCKELMTALDGVPYKIMEKIGELRTNNSGEGVFVTEPDPYVINDDRELPKQKKISALTEDEIATLEASKEGEWKDSMKNDIITKPIIVKVDLDEKYKDLSTGEKREISKRLIEKDAKEDSKIIKERVENSIGTNEPLSEELINASEERLFKEKAWINKRNLRLSDSNVPDEIKNVWKEDKAQKSGNTEAYNSLKNSLGNQWKLDAEKEKTSDENG